MAQVLIRALEPEVIEKLKARARGNRRSLEAELRIVLAEAAAQAEPRPPEDIRAQVERIRTLFAGRAFRDSAELLREDRAR